MMYLRDPQPVLQVRSAVSVERIIDAVEEWEELDVV